MLRAAPLPLLGSQPPPVSGTRPGGVLHAVGRTVRSPGPRQAQQMPRQEYSQRWPQPAGQWELPSSHFMMCCRWPPWLQPWHHTNKPLTTWWQTAHMLAQRWHLGRAGGRAPERGLLRCLQAPAPPPNSTAPPVADPAPAAHGPLAVAAVDVQGGGGLVEAADGAASAQLDHLVGHVPEAEALQ